MRIVYQALNQVVIAADATQDLWSVLANTPDTIKMLGWELTSLDIAAENMSLLFHHITALGSGGTTPTPVLADKGHNTARTATFHLEDTTPGADGGELMGYEWEQLGPVGHVWTPEMAPEAILTDGFALTVNTALTATVSGWVCWGEGQ